MQPINVYPRIWVRIPHVWATIVQLRSTRVNHLWDVVGTVPAVAVKILIGGLSAVPPSISVGLCCCSVIGMPGSAIINWRWLAFLTSCIEFGSSLQFSFATESYTFEYLVLGLIRHELCEFILVFIADNDPPFSRFVERDNMFEATELRHFRGYCLEYNLMTFMQSNSGFNSVFHFDVVIAERIFVLDVIQLVDWSDIKFNFPLVLLPLNPILCSRAIGC